MKKDFFATYSFYIMQANGRQQQDVRQKYYCNRKATEKMYFTKNKNNKLQSCIRRCKWKAVFQFEPKHVCLTVLLQLSNQLSTCILLKIKQTLWKYSCCKNFSKTNLIYLKNLKKIKIKSPQDQIWQYILIIICIS